MNYIGAESEMMYDSDVMFGVSNSSRCVVMTSELNDGQVCREIDADCYVSKQMAPTHDDQLPAASYVNGTSTPTDDGGSAAPRSDGHAQNGMDGGVWVDEGEDAQQPPVTDDEGYRVEHRFETESVSRCKEVRDLADESTELRMRETKEVTLEELKTRDGETRPATAEELRALLEAQWDGCDEVEISREVVVEEFNRVESQHEEVRSIRIIRLSITVWLLQKYRLLATLP